MSNTHLQDTDDSNPFEVGQVLDGKYEILSLLGKGGMGAVYRVRHKLLNVELALKTLDAQRLGDVSSSRRFQTEAKAAFSLKHANLVKVHDFGVLENGHPFLVMDLVQGKTLQTLIKEKGKLDFSEIEAIFVQLCSGLAHAHKQKVVHRDIKPGNIMIVDGVSLDQEGSVKILDFGIAKIVGSDRGEMEALTQTGEIFGSPLYMSPEQCAGEAIDQRSDIYSLGCVLFEALTGTTPLVGTNPLRTMMLHVNETAPSLKEATLGTQYPPALELIVAKMLAKSPADRYSDLGVVAQDLYKACTGDSCVVRGTTDDAETCHFEPAHKNGITFTHVQLGGLLSAVAALSVVATLSIDHYRRAYVDPVNGQSVVRKERPIAESIVLPTDKAGDQYVKEYETSDREVREAFERAGPIKGVEVIDNGKKVLKIVFPDLRCGTLRCGTPDIETCRFSPKVTAARTVLVDAANKIIFNISDVYDNHILENPGIFEKIDRNLFSGIDIESASDGIELATEFRNVKKTRNGIVKLLKTAASWKRLEFINFRNYDVTSPVASTLNGLPHLKDLSLITKSYDGQFMGKQQFMRKISRLYVTDGDARELLKGLSHSRELTNVFLDKDVKISAESIAILGTCPSLRMVSLTHTKYDDATIHAMKGLSQVVNLFVNIDSLTPGQKAEFYAYRELARNK